MLSLYQDNYIFEKLEESVNFKISSTFDYDIVKISGNVNIEVTNKSNTYFTLTSKGYGYGVYEVIESGYDDTYFNYIAIDSNVVVQDINGNNIPTPTTTPTTITPETGYNYYPYLSFNNNTYLVRVNDNWYNLNVTSLDSGSYKVLATVATSAPSIARLDLRVERDKITQNDKTSYTLVATDDRVKYIEFDLPDIMSGYTFSKLEYTDEVSEVAIVRNVNGKIRFHKPNTLGVYKYEIVATKDNKEYNSGTYTIIVLESIVDEDNIEVIENETYKLANVKITSGDNICYPLTITNSLTGNDSNAEVTLTEHNGSNVYTLTIIGKKVAQSTLTLYCKDIEIGTIALNVVGGTRIPNLPDRIDLISAESKTFEDIFYYNKFKYHLLDIYTDIDALFTVKVRPSAITESTPNTTYNVGRYVIEVTAKSNVSGVSNLYIKSDDGVVNLEIPVHVTRAVTTRTNIETSDNINTSDTINLQLGTTHTIQFIYDENADSMAIDVMDNDIVSVVDGIINNPCVYSINNTIKTKFFANNSIYKKLTLTGKKVGNTSVTVSTYINGNTQVNSLTFFVNVVEAGTVTIDNGLVNLYPSGKTNVNSNIMLELPEQSCTLRLKEEKEISDAMLNSSGAFFDYILDYNPTKYSNPTTYVDGVYPTWLNTTTMEIFSCIDDTTNNNVWIGTLGTKINYDKLPLPGEMGFGCGIAPDDILDKYKLTPLEGATNPLSDNFGHYIDSDNKEFVFVPLHYIKPKFTTNKEYPYFNQDFDFSYVEDINKGFDNNCIPRCFWNNGIVQNGIFVAIEDTQENNPKTITNGNTDLDFIYYPLYTKDGYHNMNLFIQTMLLNLSKLHLIKTYEKSNSVVDGKLFYKSEVLTKAISKTINTTVDSDVTTDTLHIINDVIDTKITYSNNNKVLVTHNGQKCGIPFINGGYNSLLIGAYIHSETDGNGITTLHTHVLNKNVEISSFDRSIAATISKRNSILFREELTTSLFSNSNYKLISSIPLNTIPDTIYIADERPNYLNPITNDNTLADEVGYSGFNIGIDLYYIKYIISNNRRPVNYTTTPTNNGVLLLGDTKVYDDPITSYRICISNPIPSKVEIDKIGVTLNGVEYSHLVNHPNTRITRPIFDMRSVYPMNKTYIIKYSARCCITPDMK